MINNEDIPRNDELADLPVSDQQAEQAKGGPTDQVSVNFATIEFEYKPR